MERRKRARFTLDDPLDTSVQALFDAKLLDLSADGALLQSTRPLVIGTVCRVRVPYDEGDFLLDAEVRNCQPGGLKADDAKEIKALFRVGLQFTEKGRYAVKELLSRVPGYVKKSRGGFGEVRSIADREKGPANDRWHPKPEVSVTVQVGGRDSLEPHLLEMPAGEADLPEIKEREKPAGVLKLEDAG